MRSFFAVWTKNTLLGNFEKILKIFDENSIENFNFIMIFGKFVAKNRAFGNNTIFLSNFPAWRIFPLPPPNPPVVIQYIQ